MKKRKLFLSIIVILSLMNIFVKVPVLAGTFDNATQFIKDKGEQYAYYENERFWFAQRGTKATTSTKYKIIGWRVSVKVRGTWFSVQLKNGDSVKVVSDIPYGNDYIDTLWSIDYNDVMDKLHQKHPSVDFYEAVNNNVATAFEFNAFTAVSRSGTLLGEMLNENQDSSAFTGNIYNTAAGIKAAETWTNATKTDLDRLYEIPTIIEGSKKPSTAPYSKVMIPKPNEVGWEGLPKTHYHVEGSSDYWVNLKDKFSIYVDSSIPSRKWGNNEYPNYNYLSLKGNGDENKIFAHEGTNTDIDQAHSGYDYNFQEAETSAWIGNASNYNYLFSHFRMKAKQDNKDYRISGAGVYDGTFKWVDSGKYIKTDGTAPNISTSYTANWSNKDVTISSSISDSRSGPKRVELYNETNIKVANGTTTLSYKVESEGISKYKVKALDNVNNESTKDIEVKIDKIAPNGKFTPNNQSWTNENIVASFNPSDNLSGVKQWRYAISNDNGSTYGEWSSYIIGDTTRDIKITEEGSNIIKAEVTDNAGNVKIVTSGVYDIYRTPPKVNVLIPSPNEPGWEGLPKTHYHVEGTNEYWVNLRDTFAVYVESLIPSRIWGYDIYPTYNYLSLNGNGSDNKIFAHVGADTDITEAHGGYYNNFKDPATSTWTSNAHEYNFLVTHFRMIATQDNKDYRISGTGVYNGTFEWMDSGKYIKTDGTSPKITSSYTSTWTNKDVAISSSISDNRSGPASVELYNESNNKISSGIDSLSYTVTTEGISKYTIKALDNVRNESSKELEIKIDKTAPSGVFNPNSQSWTNKNVTVSFDPSDSLSGVKKWRYAISNDNGLTYSDWSSYINGDITRNITLEEEGNNKIKVEVIDNVGNVGIVTSGSYQIDKILPRGIYTPDSKSWTKDNVNVKFIPSDNLSGVKHWRYAISNDKGETYGAWSSYIIGATTSDINLSEEGYNKIKVEVTDNASNTNTVISGIYEIDKTLPTVVFNPNDKPWTRDNITVNINPIDDLSGIKRWRYATSIDNGFKYSTWSEYIIGDTNKDITLNSEGTNKIKVEVTDNAGNVNNVVSGIYQIDKTAPTAVSYDVTDRQDDTFTIDIIGVTDNGGSGVKSEDVRVWIDTPSGRKEKLYTPIKVSDNSSKVVVNRLDFDGVTKTYYYELTLVDNVGNSRTYSSKTATMIQSNLKANRIDIYDPRDNRYVTQVISSLEYLAVVEIENDGEREISKSFDIGFKIDGIENGIYTESSGIKKGEKKEYSFKFIAGEENLKGQIYEGIADYKDVIFETNENDNIATSKKPYETPRNDENPPIIPISPPGGDKIINSPPIITVKLDLVAEDIDIVELTSDKIISEVMVEEEYRLKYKIKNNSSFSMEYIDIINKTFNNKVFFDEVEQGQVSIDTLMKGETKKFYQNFKVPLYTEDIVEGIKSIRLDVDTGNSIQETDEDNNSISKNKKIIGLKVIDYRITESINPISALKYPIYTSSMPLRVKAGYNVTFNVDVLGKPDTVYSKVTDNNGKDYGIVEMNKVRDIDNVRSEWTYTFAPSMDTPDNTIVITQIYAKRNSFIYDYNLKENWNGDTLKIGGDAKDDIIIYRKY